MSRSLALIAEMSTEFPDFRMVPKANSPRCRVIDVFLRLVTLGGQSRFMSEYHTVLGETLYLAACWESMTDAQRYILLRHERVHLRQRKRLGPLLMAVLYLFPLLPVGLALGRARIEWEAYVETLRATAEVYGVRALDDSALKRRIVTRFTGPDYGYMWPFPRQVARWYEVAQVEIQAETSSGTLHATRKNEGHS